jgi:hypothetical protein
MSEQKAFTSERIYWAVEQVEREAGDIADLHLDDNTFYLKSEADKVIAELQKQVHDYAQGLYVIQARAEKEARHQKYRRCLAVAEVCKHKRWRADVCDEKGFDYARSTNQMNRWLELAEKFKPNREQ